jgi:phytoene synthase
MSVTVRDSYAFCRKIARARARNFYYSFVLLSAEQKDAMCAMYAFMRFCDDLSDEQGSTVAAMDHWREELDAALEGRFSSHPVWPAFHDAVRRFTIPHQYFHDMISGVRSDLEPRRIETFAELYNYCYQVAGVVGLTTIHIFGFQHPDALRLAERCGIAFQLTNILRDIREDLSNGRVYVPAEDLVRFAISEFAYGEAFTKLMRFECERAEEYYRESRPLLELIDRRSRASLWALIEIYHRLLKRIEKSGFQVLDRRLRLPAWEKLAIVFQAFLSKSR